MKYSVKKIFYTIQGEGRWSGRPSVFVRMSGCNLWSGSDRDRIKGIGACASWCDSDFIGGESLSGPEIAEECRKRNEFCNVVVLTGGEPSLQVDDELVAELRSNGYFVCIETNGTRELPDIDWVTFSPKRGGDVAIENCDEIKIVMPSEIYPLDFSEFSASHRYVSPKNNTKESMIECFDFCMKNPEWSMTTQLQKTIGRE